MGDVASTSDPLAALASQVNRFGTAAPAAYQFTATDFPLATGKLDPALALTALTIYQRVSADSYNQFHDAGSASAISRANAGFADPVAFVTANLSEVTRAIGTFADSLGLPGSQPLDPGSLPLLAGGTMMMIAGLAIAFWVITRGDR